jgi:squalene synthase HpnC
MSAADARNWCRSLAHSHYENFSVLTGLVPPRLRDDFAAVYAFCRWSDDLGDESGSTERATQLLEWWRHELDACVAGSPRHPVFVALRPTMEAHDLPARPFHDLIDAFQQDQTVTRYDTWDQLTDYCTRSANPVGRLVLGLFGQATPDRLALSDCTCTALQVTNHLQDVRRDLLERDRIYLPRDATASISDFERRLRQTAQQGFACDHQFLAQYRAALQPLVARTWQLFERGDALLATLPKEAVPVVRLFGEGGAHVLRSVQDWNYETCVHRPTSGKLTKLRLLARAWWGAR